MSLIGLSRDDFMAQVVNGNERPKLDKAWPSGFSNMLTSCWHRDPQVRPSFDSLVTLLDKLINDHMHNSIWPRRGRNFASSSDSSSTTPKSSKEKDSHSTWF